MSRLPHAQRLAEILVLLLVGFSILWRGGKSVDATWLLAIVTIVVLCWPLALSLMGRRDSEDAKAPLVTVPLPLWGMLLAFVVWTMISYAVSSVRTYGLDEVLRDASCVLLFLWVARRAGNQRSSLLMDGFLRTVTIASGIALLFGLIVYALQPVSRFTGTFLDWRFHTDYWPNAWAEFALLAWPLAVLLAIRTRDHRARWACIVIGGLLIGSIFLSYSRGGMLALVGQLVLVALISGALVLRDVRVTKIVRERGYAIAAALILLPAIAVAFFLTSNAIRSVRYDVESVAAKATFQSDEGTSSISERSQFFGQALTLALERPLTGYGPYSFRFSQPHLMNGALQTSDHPHNVFLKLAAERGWIAMFLFMGILGYVGLLTLDHLFFDRKNDWSLGKDIRTILIFIAIAGVLAHNLIDYNLQFVGLVLPFWILLAFLATDLSEKRPMSRASFSHWRLARSWTRVESLIVIFCLVLVLVEGAFLVTSSLGRRAEAKGSASGALLWYDRSSPEWFSRDLLLSHARLLERTGKLDEADTVIASSLNENRIDARAWRMRAELALQRKEPGLAVQYAAHAYQLGRYTDIGILRTWLEAAKQSGTLENLRGRKEEFDTVFASFAEAVEQNSHFIALSQNVEELEGVAELLAQLFPTDAVRYRLIAASAAEHAEEERSKVSARPPGLLW